MSNNIAALLTGKGSSSFKNKNILPVLGKPVMSYPAEAAKNSRYINYFYVSSDDRSILEIAKEMGYVKISRPKRLARPDSKHVDVIMHALDRIKTDLGIFPDILVVLLANSATIKTEWIDSCIREVLKNRGLSAAVPVCMDLDRHPFRAKKISKEGRLEPFFDFKGKRISTNRQELEPSYFLCHNFWVLNVGKSIFSKKGQAPWTFMGDKVKPFIVEECCDIHTEKDLRITEEWLQKNLGRRGRHG